MAGSRKALLRKVSPHRGTGRYLEYVRGKARDQALKREHRAMRRSLAAEHGAKMRSLRKQQAENGEAIRKRREVRDREFEAKRWDLLVGKR